MSRLKRFETLIGLARENERNAARLLGSANQQLEREQRQLDALHAHFKEYGTRLSGSGEQGGTLAASTLREYQHFLGQLDHGIDEQTRRVDQQRQTCERSNKSWLQSRVRLQALDKAAGRIRQDEQQVSDRREQTEMDDLVNQRRR